MPEYQSYKNKRNDKGGQSLRGGRLEIESRSQPPTRGAEKTPPPLKMPRRRKPSRRPSDRTPEIRGSVRKRRVRQNYVIHFALVAILFVTGFAVLSVTVFFNAEKVVIKGESSYSDEEIMAAGNIEMGVNLIRFGSGQAQDDIIDSLIRLDEVTVKRVFPSTITITVERAERIFSFYSDGAYFEVSQKGRIINSESKRPKGLIINGLMLESAAVGDYLDHAADVNESGEHSVDADAITDDKEKIELIFRLVELIGKHGLTEIGRIDIADRFDIKMFTGIAGNERVEVKLGAANQLDEKLAVTAKIISKEIAEGEKGVLRVSTPRKASFNPTA
jgi:cell division septal protein FtsQ